MPSLPGIAESIHLVGSEFVDLVGRGVMPNPATEGVDRDHNNERQNGGNDGREHILVGRLKGRTVDPSRPRPQHPQRSEHEPDEGRHHRVVVVA